MSEVTPNAAELVVRHEALVGPLLARVVGMLAARAQCPVDRLDDAMLLTDAVAAHAPGRGLSGTTRIQVRTEPGGLALHIGPLVDGGAQQLLDDADLPGVGNVFQRVADTVRTEPGADGESLVVELGFGR